MLRFYWELGKDMVEMNIENRWGEGVMDALSMDLRQLIPDAHCFSKTNLYYMKRFYLLYKSEVEIVPQVGAKIGTNEIVPQVGAKLETNLFAIPWGHHKIILDKCSNNLAKALYYARQTVENGWSRAMLLNFLDTDLYEREGKALTNFKRTLPDETSDLAQEITKDPYNFAFAGITKRYNERLLKEQLLKNITKFLLELGTGFSYVGREYRLQIGETEKFVDLLFYHLNLRCFVVIEVKITKFDFSDIGQIGGYVVAANHLLRKEGDNPTIGLLICKDKDNMVARYALESTNQPIAISEYELSKLYPKNVEGEIPSIEEIESRLTDYDTEPNI